MSEEEKLINEIIDEILEEERQSEIKRQEILKKSCHCTNKIERIGTFSKIHFLECSVCYRQFDIDGNPIE